MDRSKALELVKNETGNDNLVKHMLAAEAIMRAVARRLDEDEEKWGIAGLVHDVDLGRVGNDMESHGLVGAEILREHGFDEDIILTVLAHAEKSPRVSKMEKALYAIDPLTGLIVASALIHQDKKLASIDAAFVANRFKESGFARGARREAIAECKDIGLELDELFKLGYEAMLGIAQELGL